MDCDFSPSSPHLLPNGLFSPQNRISFELLALSGLLGFSTFKGGKMLIFQGFANSRIVREFPPFSFKVRIATLTRNDPQGSVGSNPTRSAILTKRYRCVWRKVRRINRFRAFSSPDFFSQTIDANRCFRASAPIRTGRFPVSCRCVQPAPFFSGVFPGWQQRFLKKES